MTLLPAQQQTALTLARPTWHDRAACRGDSPSRWTLELGDNIAPLRDTCRQCPVAGRCLQEALSEPTSQRLFGPVRVGLSGRAWRKIPALVVELEPFTLADWDALAVMILER